MRVKIEEMSTTLLRFGLWIVLLVLGAYVLRETFAEAPETEYLAIPFLQKIGSFGLILIAVGAALGFVEKLMRKAQKTRCSVCRKPVLRGELYCRPHLRQMIEEEDDRFHKTQLPRR
jgi:hypothetical protein